MKFSLSYVAQLEIGSRVEKMCTPTFQICYGQRKLSILNCDLREKNMLCLKLRLKLSKPGAFENEVEKLIAQRI